MHIAAMKPESLDIDDLDKNLVSKEEKIQKEKDKLIQVWEEEGIRIEKARWGRSNILKGKQKVELGKDIDATKITLKEAIAYLEAAAPKKKTRKKSKK